MDFLRTFVEEAKLDGTASVLGNFFHIQGAIVNEVGQLQAQRLAARCRDCGALFCSAK